LLLEKEIIYNDIIETYFINREDLDKYSLSYIDNIHWLYSPIIIRAENTSVIFAWSYVISEGNILSSQIYIYSEDDLRTGHSSIYKAQPDLQSHYIKIEKIINENSKMFPDSIFENFFDKIVSKYSLELIIQEGGYRIRFRPLLVDEITYDLYYDDKRDELKFNIFNPEL